MVWGVVLGVAGEGAAVVASWLVGCGMGVQGSTGRIGGAACGSGGTLGRLPVGLWVVAAGLVERAVAQMVQESILEVA